MDIYGNSLEMLKRKTRNGLNEGKYINRISPVTNNTLEIECDNGDLFLVTFQKIEVSVFGRKKTE